MKNLGRVVVMAVAAVVLLAGTVLGADEAFRARLVENRGSHLVVRTEWGSERRSVLLSKKVVVVSHQKTTTDVRRIMMNSMLLLSLTGGEVTTIVVEEVPR